MSQNEADLGSIADGEEIPDSEEEVNQSEGPIDIEEALVNDTSEESEDS